MEILKIPAKYTSLHTTKWTLLEKIGLNIYNIEKSQGILRIVINKEKKSV